MTISYANVEADIGRFFVVTINDVTGTKHRRPLEPGRFTDAAAWVATDLSAEAPETQTFANGLWTPQVIDAYKAKFPWVPPAPPTAEQIRDATFKVDADRIDMVTRLKNATPAQIDTYIENNVTNLAQARTFLKRLTKVLATVVRD